MLYHWVEGFSNAPSQDFVYPYDFGSYPSSSGFNWNTVTGADVTTYYTEENYFQKSSVTDAAGDMTTFGYGSEDDPNPGNRGNLLWVRDARHQPDGTAFRVPSMTRTAKRISQTDLNGVVTQYTYGDQWGNLTCVMPRPNPNPDDGLPHLNRTTIMQSDAAGMFTARWIRTITASIPPTTSPATMPPPCGPPTSASQSTRTSPLLTPRMYTTSTRLTAGCREQLTGHGDDIPSIRGRSV